MRGLILFIFITSVCTNELDINSFFKYRFAKLKSTIPDVTKQKLINGFMRDRKTFITCKFTQGIISSPFLFSASLHDEHRPISSSKTWRNSLSRKKHVKMVGLTIFLMERKMSKEHLARIIMAFINSQEGARGPDRIPCVPELTQFLPKINIPGSRVFSRTLN